MRRVRRKSSVDYLLPFLMIVGLGIIVVLGFQLFSSFQKGQQGDVYFYVAQGSAKVLPYGETEWDTAFSGTKFLIGDSLKTSQSGRAVLEFFNGTIVRIDKDTAITLVDLNIQPGREDILIKLDNGNLWLNGNKSQGVQEAYYEVRTSNMKVKAKGTIFEVEGDETEVVRVYDGDVEADIYVKSNGRERIADTVSVGVGQEITLDEATLNAYAQNKAPSVLKAISDEFEDTIWFSWNEREDVSPTDFGKSKRVVEEIDEEKTDGEEEESMEEVTTELGAPKITDPATSEITIEDDELTISGTVDKGTAQVIVEVNGDEHILGKFAEGDTSWDYNISLAIGNIETGKNTYKVYAVNENGDKSASSRVIVNLEKPEITDPLEDPEVLTFNDEKSNVVTVDEVIVEGKVSGAEKIVVNDYTLSAFQPGDTTWKYFARESVGNLKPGENEYEIYAIDEEGNKSEIVKFTIIYEKEEDAVPEYGF